MWNLKTQRKQTIENKSKLINTEIRLVVTGGEGAEGWAKWVKGANYIVMGGNQIDVGDHFIVYTDVEVQCYIPAIYTI